MKGFEEYFSERVSGADRELLEERVSQEERKILEDYIGRVREFVERHRGKGSKSVMLLTSGGTSVSLEKHTVRMVENFSTGSRGSLLAQQILEEGYPLIYFYRDNSFLPYFAGVTASGLALSQDQKSIQHFIRSRQKLKHNSPNLLLLPFKTIYFYLLGTLILKQLLPPKSILILCAAVSDFIPESISEHKIQTQDKLEIKFKNSPKILGCLVDSRHVTISFKLETEKEKINDRIRFAIEKYNVDMVVGNLLNNKKWVRIAYNKNLLAPGQKEYEEYHQQIEKMIIHNAIRCQELKFGHQ